MSDKCLLITKEEIRWLMERRQKAEERKDMPYDAMVDKTSPTDKMSCQHSGAKLGPKEETVKVVAWMNSFGFITFVDERYNNLPEAATRVKVEFV